MAKKILIADDDNAIREVMTLYLRDAGYEVEAASNGKEAYIAALNGKPDCILLDVDMPLMDGGEVAQALRMNAETAEIPVIFCTGLVKKDELRYGTAGKHHYIGKPVRENELLKRLNEILGE